MTGRRMPGVAIGIVQEIDTSLARLRVQLPWLGEEVVSAWAPIATPLTGGSRGMYFLPEVGDEVLVAFEHGDFDHPFVLGFLWNGVDMPPEDDKNLRVILTPGGHTLRFEDTDGAKKIRIETADGRRITMDDAPGAGKIHIESGQHEVLLDDTPGAGRILASTGGGQKLTLSDVPPTAKLEIATGLSLELGPSGMTLNVPAGAVTVNAGAGAVSINSGTAVSVQATAVNVSAGAVTVNAPVTTFAGVVNAQTLIATAVVATTYTPGVGNLI